MNKIYTILSNIKNNIPQALARFNDGEMLGIEKVGSVVARGDQTVDQSLSVKLKEALQHQQKNYWVGIPCSHCWRKHYRRAMKLIDKEYPYLTSAVVTTNRNWKLFRDTFGKNIDAHKKLIWISGADQNMSELEKILHHAIHEHITLPTHNAWKEYENIHTRAHEFESGSVIALSCGPTSRVLAKEWFEERPDCTFIDVGSVFDPYTRNVWNNCHTGTLKPCRECN